MNLPVLDALCEDPRSEVRLGAVQAVAWAWKRHGDKDGLTHRLAARLDDAAPSVSAKAADEILDGIRRNVVLGDVGADVLSRLCRGIESGSESIATFLEEYAASKPERSEGLLAAMSSGTAGGARAAQLARVCSDVVAGRHQAPCRSCGRLGSREEWGERIGEPDVPPPPDFARLQRAGESPEGVHQLYRCPDCGALSSFESSSRTIKAETRRGTGTRSHPGARRMSGTFMTRPPRVISARWSRGCNRPIREPASGCFAL
jgi:hypothetical protein